MGSFSAKAAYSRNSPWAAADMRRRGVSRSPSASPARSSNGPGSAPRWRKAAIAHLTANPVTVGSACRVAPMVSPRAPQRLICAASRDAPKGMASRCATTEARRSSALLRRSSDEYGLSLFAIRSRDVNSNSNSSPIHRHLNKWLLDLKLVGKDRRLAAIKTIAAHGSPSRSAHPHAQHK